MDRISKRITKWDIEILNNNIPLNYLEPTYTLFDLEFSISLPDMNTQEIEVGVYIKLFICTGRYKKQLRPDISNKIFELTTISKFKFGDPVIEDAAIKIVYNCIVRATQDFNKEVASLQSQLVKNINPSEGNVQYPISSLESMSPLIIDVWRMNIQAN